MNRWSSLPQLPDFQTRRIPLGKKVKDEEYGSDAKAEARCQ